MKKLIFLLAVCTPILLTAQRKPKIKGNRSVVEVAEDLPAFNAIELNDNLDVILKKSSSDGYEITADDNLIDVLKFKVEDSTLIVSSFYNITAKKKCEITINFQELKTITQRDGKITMKGMLSTDNLNINTYKSAKLDVRASAFVANVNMEGNSKGDFNLDVDSLNINLMGKSDANIYSVSSIKEISLRNTASLEMDGSTDSLNLKMHNNTKFIGQKLGAGAANLDVKESALARVNVFREIILKSSGNGKTYLYGDPKITIEEFLDTSQLLKKKN